MPDVDVPTIIQATLAPAFLVSGAAIFLTFAQARLFRVIDRLRAIGPALRTEEDPEERRELLRQRGRALRRALILRNGVLFGVLVIGFTLITAFLLLVPSILAGQNPKGWTIGMFVAALASFSVALVLVAWDCILSVTSARYAAREFHEGLRPGEDQEEA